MISGLLHRDRHFTRDVVAITFVLSSVWYETAAQSDCQHAMVGGTGPCICPAHAHNIVGGSCTCDDGYHEENGRHGTFCALGAPACEANAHHNGVECECDYGYAPTGGADQHGNPMPACERTACDNQVAPSWDTNLNCCPDTYEGDGNCDELGSGSGCGAVDPSAHDARDRDPGREQQSLTRVEARVKFILYCTLVLQQKPDKRAKRGHTRGGGSIVLLRTAVYRSQAASQKKLPLPRAGQQQQLAAAPAAAGQLQPHCSAQ